MGKYEEWLKKKEIPSEVSIVELSVFGRRLGIDVDAINDKHTDAMFAELLEAVKAKGIVQQG